MLEASAWGFLLGVSLAAPPGPMNALIARESVARGWGAGVRVGTGAPVADVLWLVAMAFGIGAVVDGPTPLRVAAGFGAVLLSWFAWQAWHEREPEAATRPATFLGGLAAALLNPFQAAWWLSGGFVFVQSQGLAGIPGFLLGIFGWVVLFAWLIAHGAHRWAWFATTIRALSTLLLAAFALLLAVVAGGVVAP